MPPRPDLTAAFKGPSSAAQGENITAKVKTYIKNRGTVEARNFYVDIVLRETTETDHRLGRASIGSLAAERSATLNFGTVIIPSDIPLGNYHLCVIADSTNMVVEGTHNEGNNTFCQRITIGVR
jgi:subtilase family serine protease